MLIAIFPLLVTLVGMLAYGLSSNPKLAELGRLTFFAGLLVTVSIAAHTTVRLP